MKAIILAGSEDTFLAQNVNNRPFLEYQLLFLKKNGVADIIVCLSDNKKELSALIDEKKLDLHITFSYEKEPLGTAGAVRNAYDFFKDEQEVFVINADTMLNVPLEKIKTFFEKKQADVVIALARVENVSTFGHIETDADGRITDFAEKLQHLHTKGTVNGGIYLIRTAMLKLLATGEKISFEKEVFPSLISVQKKIFGYESEGEFFDIHRTAEKELVSKLHTFNLK